jgi:hypothetical protein
MLRYKPHQCYEPHRIQRHSPAYVLFRITQIYSDPINKDSYKQQC